MKTKLFFLAMYVFAMLGVKAQTLLTEYKFTGANGTDHSGNGNTGTIHGTSTTGNVLVIGSNTLDYFSMPFGPLHNKMAFSISFRVNFTGFNTIGNFATNH